MSEPITNAADAVRVLGAVPAPMGPGPQSRSILDRARDALGARMTKDDLRLVLENVINYAAGLEAERHSANEALDDAAQALCERQAEREALVERMSAGQTWQRGRNPELVSEDRVSQSELRKIFGIPLMPPWEGEDALTQTFAPVASLREVPDGEHAAWVRHSYRTPHDLPETGGDHSC